MSRPGTVFGDSRRRCAPRGLLSLKAARSAGPISRCSREWGAETARPAAALAQLKVAVPAEAEAVAIRTGARYQRKPAIVLAGGDGAGLMYAALDLADRIGWAQSGGDPFQFARDTVEKPYLKERGVVMLR